MSITCGHDNKTFAKIHGIPTQFIMHFPIETMLCRNPCSQASHQSLYDPQQKGPCSLGYHGVRAIMGLIDTNAMNNCSFRKICSEFPRGYQEHIPSPIFSASSLSLILIFCLPLLLSLGIVSEDSVSKL